MDGHGLLAFMESIRGDVPGPLQWAFNDLLQLVKSIVDALDQVVAPPEVIDTGKQHLSNYHGTLLTHASTLKNYLDDFQTTYTGQGSDAYFQTAYQAHLQLGHLTDHLSFAIDAHNTISNNLGGGQIAQGALFGFMAVMIPTAVTLPEGTPVMAGEGAGAGFSVAALWAAMQAIGATLAGLATAALPYVAVTAVALVLVTSLTSDAPQVQVQQSSIAIDLGLANDPAIDKWRNAIRNALKAKGLTDQQILLALATAAAIVKALECAGLTAGEINNLMSQFGNLYNPKMWANAGKGSFWYSLAVLVLAATGGTVRISPMNIPYPVSASSIINARRVVRALLDPTGTDGSGNPIPGGAAAITGGPGNVKAFGQTYYVGPGGVVLTQKQYSKLPPADRKLYQQTEVDIQTNDGKNIEVGGVNKGGYFDSTSGTFVTSTAAFKEQLERLTKLPGGAAAAYCILEQPPGGPSDPQWPQFEAAVNTANSVLGPDHVIILNPQSSSCTIP